MTAVRVASSSYWTRSIRSPHEGIPCTLGTATLEMLQHYGLAHNELVGFPAGDPSVKCRQLGPRHPMFVTEVHEAGLGRRLPARRPACSPLPPPADLQLSGWRTLLHLHLLERLGGATKICQPLELFGGGSCSSNMAQTRCILNDFDPLLTLERRPQDLLQQAAEEVIRSCPPKESYTFSETERLGGLLAGPTGLAYLFLHLSVSHPKLRVDGKPPVHWAEAYIAPKRHGLPDHPDACGLIVEKLCHEAVRASITKDLNHVRTFVSSLAPVIAPKVEGRSEDTFATELLYGRSGALYLLRMIRHFVPNSAALLARAIVLLTDRILATDDDGRGNWTWNGTRYIGAGHGDIGILTQLVLTTPPLAPALTAKLEGLLALQLPDGNWAASPEEQESKMVQWCHGAPGLVLCLLSLRPFFPTLHDKIDVAIERGRACTWDKGLLKKEPSLCHGILGNAL
jgi:hypothetical protein